MPRMERPRHDDGLGQRRLKDGKGDVLPPEVDGRHLTAMDQSFTMGLPLVHCTRRIVLERNISVS